MKKKFYITARYTYEKKVSEWKPEVWDFSRVCMSHLASPREQYVHPVGIGQKSLYDPQRR